MGKDKGYRTIQELVSALADAERGLASGALQMEGLDTACNDARDLYERLVVLRHKARESAATPVARNTYKAAPPAAVVAEASAEVEESGPLRLETRPPAVSPRQTSLIEAIEETSEELDLQEPVAPIKKEAAPTPSPSVAATKNVAEAAPAKAGSTLAEKLEKATITDLSKAISLSHKFWFVAELFGGDRIFYDKSIGLLNALGDKEHAIAYVENDVLSKLKKTADPEALSTFMDLIDRRYP